MFLYVLNATSMIKVLILNKYNLIYLICINLRYYNFIDYL